MFMGTHYLKLDAKGRFFLPTKYREQFEDGLVIVKGQEHSLDIYRMEDFIVMAKKYAEAPQTLKEVRNYNRMLGASAYDQTLDTQGRGSIPLPLRKYAGLVKEIVIFGSLFHLEVWNPEAWEKYHEEQEPEFSGIDSEIFNRR